MTDKEKETKKLGIEVIKRLHEMGKNEEEIGEALFNSMSEVLWENITDEQKAEYDNNYETFRLRNLEELEKLKEKELPPALSEKRLNETTQHLKDMGVELPKREIRLYANLFEIAAHFTNNKLTTLELLEAYDYFSDLILNLKPKVMIHVPKEERIRAQVKLMDSIPQTAGKLSASEKELFAFCVYLSACVEVFNEELEITEKGLVLFTSVEAIEAEYEDTKKIKPYLFEDRDTVNDEEAEDYGYTPENPIKTITIGDAYAFLDRLGVEDGKVTYRRLGSCSGKQNIVDCYEVTITKKSLFKKTTSTCNLYVDSYASVNSTKPPKPFILL